LVSAISDSPADTQVRILVERFGADDFSINVDGTFSSSVGSYSVSA
jgi:hypothetical protein